VPSLIRRFALLICLTSWLIPGVDAARAETAHTDLRLVEHSSDVFFGTVDIATRGTGDPTATEFTILTTEVLKGDLSVPSLIVVRQEGDATLVPKAEYLFFTYYDPALLRYVITDPGTGIVPITSPDQRSDLATHWSGLIEQTACGYTDVLKLDGVVYARRDWNEDKHYLERDWVGPTIATVERQDTAATSCRIDLVDRTASVIPAGTKIQELKGYAPAFRVAVRMPDRHRYLYEAIWSEKAKSGADLLDIRGRVASITWADSTDCPENAVCDVAAFPTDDPDVIARVVDLVLDAPVGSVTFRIDGDWSRGISLLFGLKDASTAYIYFPASGSSQSGIKVPLEELQAALRGRAEP
jgi:hypothetical protein